MLCPVGISEGAPGDQGVPRPGPTRIAQPVWQEQRQLRAPLHPHRQVTGRRIWQDCGYRFHKSWSEAYFNFGQCNLFVFKEYNTYVYISNSKGSRKKSYY